MKVKLLMAMALSGLLVTSPAFAEPANAFNPVDDMNATAPTPPATSPDANSPATGAPSSNANGMPMPNPDAATASPTDIPANADVSVDTATGDDDY